MLSTYFETQVDRTPDNRAVKTPDRFFTYRELDNYANSIALLVRDAQDTGPVFDTGGVARIALLLPHGVEMIAAIIGVFKAGKAYVPLSVDYPFNRLSYMVENSHCSMILTVPEQETLATELAQHSQVEYRVIPGEGNDRLQLTSSRQITDNNGQLADGTAVDRGDRLAYIMYTSGSTGRPKGVIQQHERVYYYVRNWIEFFNITADDKLTLFSSFCHDGSVQDMWAALLSGACLYPLDIRSRTGVDQLAEWLEREKITVWHSVPSLFAFFVNILDEFSASGSDRPDLSLIRAVLLGGEPVRQHEVDIFNRHFSHAILANVYGATESSVSTIRIFQPGETVEYFTIGQPLDETEILVLNEDDAEVDPYETGEIVVLCKHLSPGYWNNPDATEAVFIDDDELGATYFTGDLGRLLPDGEIEFMGRRDSQVKLRGFRVELGEIETRLLKHPGVGEAVVMALEKENGDKELCAYFVPPENGEFSDGPGDAVLRNFLADDVPDYMIPAHFVGLDKFPLTQSGKIDRNALPKPELGTGETAYAAPDTDIEKELADIWCGVLTGSEPGIDDNFFRLGGHSLTAVTVISRIHKRIGVKLNVAQVFRTPTIREMAAFIEGETKSEDVFASIPAAPKQEFYPLSSAQKRLYIIQQLDDTGIGYNLPGMYLLEGSLDMERFRRAVDALVRRHESLRTAFPVRDDEPVQKVVDDARVEIEYTGAFDGTEKEFIRRFIRPFDLTAAPLMRVGLLFRKENDHLFLVDLHHIISDGISLTRLVHDLMNLYEGRQPEPLSVQYKDYCYWQTRDEAVNAGKTREAYWTRLFSQEVPVLNLPYDFPRPAVQRFEGDRRGFFLDEDVTRQLKAVALDSDVTMYIVLLTMFNIFLSRLSGQEDIVVGTVVSGRYHEELQPVIGMFVNTLALWNRPAGDKTFETFLRDVKTTAMEAFDNQEYQFEDLVEQVNVRRDISRNPLFDATFRMQNFGLDAEELRDFAGREGLSLRHYPFDNNVSKFDISLAGVEGEDAVFFKLEYSTNLFKTETVDRWISYFKTLVSSALKNPREALSRLELMSGEEKMQILERFNDTRIDFPSQQTIHGMFAEQVVRTPDAPALGMHGREGGLSYRQMDDRSSALSSQLRRQGLGPGDIAAVMIERSIDMMLAIFAVLKTGAAYLPIEPSHPADRILYILEDSNARLLITTPGFEHAVIRTSDQPPAVQPAEFPGLRFVEIDRRDNAGGYDSRNHGLKGQASDPGDLAYIIYTSGSTGKPKGVMVEHGSVMNRLHWMQRFYPIGPGDVILQKTTYVFDVSVWELFWWSFYGASLCLLPHGEEKNPASIAGAIAANGITTIHFVPSMLGAFLHYLSETGEAEEKNVRFDSRLTSSLRYVFASGEALGVQHVRDFNRLCRGDGKGVSPRLINLYGPTEATVDVSYFDCPGAGEVDLPSIPIGKPIDNTRLYIFNPALRLQPVGIAGELHIAGTGLARGYLNRPELTAEKFIQVHGSELLTRSEKNEEITGKSEPFSSMTRLYKTGDLTRWLADGNIEFLGRIDFQVKIRGFRIELGEIEERLASFPGVRTAAVAVRGETDSFLCGYVEADTGCSGEQLKKHLGQTLPDYMIPAHFVIMERMPLTVSGKIDRKKLPAPEIGGGTDYIAPRDDIEKRLTEIWAGALGIEPGVIGIRHNFFDLGGHSLRANMVIMKIHREMNMKILLAELFRMPTVMQLAEHIRGLSGTVRGRSFSGIERAEEKPFYPLTPAQERQYILHQVMHDSTAYNISYCFKVTGELDVVKLENVFKQMIGRHESFRTSFEMRDGAPVQRVHDHVEFRVRQVRFSGEDDDMLSPYIRPFDLSRAPLLRVYYGAHPGGFDLLLVDMHHIVFDGRSGRIFWNEVASLYLDRPIETPGVRYVDYAEWLNRPDTREQVAAQASYWQEAFAGEIPQINLPIDFPRPSVQDFSGDTAEFSIPGHEVRGMRELARTGETTLFSVFISLLAVFLAKISGQEDTVIGTPVENRRHADLNDVIGMFVNTLALRVYPETEVSFRDLLKGVTKTVLEAFENQEYPFEELVEALQVSRDTGRNPLFDVMFGFEERAHTAGVRSALPLEGFGAKREVARFDLTLFIDVSGDDTLCRLQYSTALFSAETAARFTRFFRRALSSVVMDPDRVIRDIDIISEEEKKRLLEEFSCAGGPEYPDNMTLAGFFVDQAARTPDRIASIGVPGGGDGTAGLEVQVTYRELERASGRLARRLIERGAVPGAIVALMADRCLEMMTGIWGILKAGCAYLPIEPGYPADRIAYMIEDSGASIMVTTPGHESNSHLAVMDDHVPVREPDVAGEPAGGTDCTVNGNLDDLAYIIYTSGTTGKPKGTMTTQANVLRVVKEANYIDIYEHDRILQLSNYAFDGSVFDIYGAYLNGAALVMIDREELLAVDRLSARIAREHITIFFVTTALFNALVDLDIHALKGIKKVLFGGERVSVSHVRRAFDFLGPGRILHVYGPTETTVYASYYSIDHVPENPLTIPIGKPLTHTSLLVLNKHLKPVPIGVYGELYIGGTGVARGYLNRPEVTANLFLDTDYISSNCEPGQKIPTALKAPKENQSTLNKRFWESRTLFSKRVLAAGGNLFYKTGDLVRWLPGGDIEFFGRIDQQVKIRGFRVELGEIEAEIMGFPGIKDVTVRIFQDETGDKQLCAYVVLDAPGIEADGFGGLREYLSGKLPEVMVPVYYVVLERIPLNSSGKVDSRALPEPGRPVGGNYVAARDDVERELIELWGDVLGMPSDTIGIDDNFFRLGGHSLKATVLISRIHKEFHVKISLGQVFEASKVRDMAALIKNAAPERYSAIPLLEERAYYPMSFNQKRLWFLNRQYPDSPAFNLSGRIIFGCEVDVEVLRRAVLLLVERHEGFRTVFREIDHKPVQVILPMESIRLELESVYLDGPEPERLEEQGRNVYRAFYRRIFDLTEAPLLRLIWVKYGPASSRLFYNMHHIISDGWSVEVFRRELIGVYESLRDGKPVKLSSLPVRYRDFASWSTAKVRDGGENNPSFRFWLETLSTGVPAMQMPRLPGGDPESVKGSAYSHMIDADMKTALERLAEEGNTSLFVVMITFYLLVLRRYTNQEEVVTSVISAGRSHESLGSLVGFFVQSLLFKMDIEDEESFLQFLARVHGRVMDLFRHQDYPLEPVFEKLNTRYPEVPVSFNMMNVRSETGRGEFEPFEPYHVPETLEVKFDLEPYIAEYENGLTIWWSYRSSIFDPAAIEHFVRDYLRLLDYFTVNPGKSYADFRQSQRQSKKKRTFKRG